MDRTVEWLHLHWATLYLASEWGIRLAMLFTVPQRRVPSAARAWLLLIFLAPWPGLVLYFYIGRIDLPRWRVDLRKQAVELVNQLKVQGPHRAEPKVPERFGPMMELASRLGPFAPVRGNRVELLDNYDGTIDRLVTDIDGARGHVHLEYYIFAADSTGRRVTDAVIRAAQRGVACRVLLDSVGAAEGIRRLGPDMRAAGVELTILLPASLWRRRAGRYDLRNHRKIAVIDGTTGYLGSQNIADRTRHHPGTSNEELVARITGPLVSHVQGVFLADRFYEKKSMIEDSGLFPSHEAGGSVDAQLVPSGPGYHRENFLLLLMGLLGVARNRVMIATPYLIPDEPLIRAMQSAVIRGVDVRIVTPRVSDQVFIALAQKSFYGDLLEAGVRIHLYEPAFLHAKHISVDDELCVIGSGNIDIRSFALNAEISGIFYDRETTAALRKVQERYLAHSSELRKEEWEKRPFSRRVVQNIARLADSIL